MRNLIIKSSLFIFIVIHISNAVSLTQNLPTLKDIDEKNIHKDLEELTSDKYQGREAGLKGGILAGDFILNQIVGFGLQPLFGEKGQNARNDYVQNFQIIGVAPADVHTTLNIQIDDSSFTARVNEDYFYFFNSPQKLNLETPVVFTGYGIQSPEYRYDDFQGLDINGKIIVAFYGEPLEKDSLIFFNGRHQTKYMMEYWKAENVAARGGKALILIPTPDNRQNYERFLERRKSSKDRKPFVLQDDSAVPVIYFSPEFSDRLFGEWLQNNFMTTEATIKNEARQTSRPVIGWDRSGFPGMSWHLSLDYDNPEIRNCRNILAVVPGIASDISKEFIVVGSHYDHEGIREGQLYPGADDNASGVTANLNVAYAFSKLSENKRPERSVMFSFWDAEEEGTLGTRYFVEHPPVSLQNIKIAFNMDMIGRDASFNFAALRKPMMDEDAANKVMLFYSAQAEGLEEMARTANSASHLHLLFDPNVFFTSGSDHVNFHSLGIPVVYYFTGFHTDYTSPGDTVDKINFEKLTRIARHIADFTYLLSNSSQIPKFDTQILTAPEGDFTR